MKVSNHFALVMGLLVSFPAFAQEAGPFKADHFEPLPAATQELGSVATSSTLSHLTPSVSLHIHYADDVVQVVREDAILARLISQQLVLEPSVAIGLFDIFQLGLTLPAIVHQQGDAFAEVEADGFSSASLGDLRIVPKVQILDREKFAGFGLALLGVIALPTGDEDSYASDGSPRGEPRLVLDYRHASSGFHLTTNVGFLVRKSRHAGSYVSGNAVRYGAGVAIPVAKPVTLFATLFGLTAVEKGFDPALVEQAVSNSTAHPGEWNAGARFHLPGGAMAQVAAGTGITNGVGAPDFRIFGTLGWSPSDGDRDGDGIPDRSDKCPDDPGPAENDGCPWPDTDGDGLIDPEDRCPEVPGPVENQGCPYGDNDGDGIPNDQDKCPDVAGPAENDGCPWADSDGDGIPDNLDKCPLDPEDKDGFQDEDGCPDLDNDGDGILDVDDDCPNEPETINGFEDDDGCPDEGESKVRVTDTQIEILDKVFFDFNKATIRPESFNLLRQVGATLRANANITKIQIEGHTDAVGKADYNLNLSQQRADAVRTFLIEYGIAADRMTSVGFGLTRPIASNDTQQGRDQNRRVEFNIIERKTEEQP